MSRKERNSGAAMVIVLCVMVVFLALSATILLAGSVTLNTARNNVTYERGKVQAASLSELFVKDLQDESNMTKEDSLPAYVRKKILEGWPVYDEAADNYNADGVVKTFNMDSSKDEKHQIRIEMYWTSTKPVPDAPIADDVTFRDACIEGEDAEVHLYVDVISTLNNSEYHVKRKFKLSMIEDSTYTATGGYIWKWEAVGRSEDRDK